MNKFYTTYIFILIISSISAQSLRQHSVDSLDSLNKIAQKYGVLVEDIIELADAISYANQDFDDHLQLSANGLSPQKFINAFLP